MTPRPVVIVNSRSKRRWPWRTPNHPAWLGWTVTARLGFVLVLVLAGSGACR